MKYPCKVCQTEDPDKPMCFRMTDACCENHRKVIDGEVEPAAKDWVTMDKDLFYQCDDDWGAPEGTKRKRRERNKGI